MQMTHLLLLARGWQQCAAAPATGAIGYPHGLMALAESIGVQARVLHSMLLVAGEDESDSGEVLTGAASDGSAGTVIRLVVPTESGVVRVVATELPQAITAPGAQNGIERYREAGLRLGRHASTGVIWCDPPETDPSATTAAQLDALWVGVLLGMQRPGCDDRQAPPEPPGFADSCVGELVLPSERARAQAQAIWWVRDLVERPANLLGPEEFAQEIHAFAAAHGVGVDVEVWRADALAERRFGALLAVGTGSVRPPLAVRMRWGRASSACEPGAPDARRALSDGALGLVGKGITFDTGGVNLKRDPGELAWMKSDMAAAASIAAAVVFASQLGGDGPGVEAILPICDNTLSGAAVRPGDVVTHPDGRTTEVVDTDCEGRLVIADGLSWLRSQGAAMLLDSGTLTDGGAGMLRTGVWANDPELSRALIARAEAAGDPLWALPLPYGEAQVLQSSVADLRNAPTDRPDMGRHAAIYLALIAADTPWVHLDIGGTAYLESECAGWPEGPTGAGTVAIAEAILAWNAGSLQ